MKTIAKNSRRINAELKPQLTVCTVYNLENHFRGQRCDPAHAWTGLDRGLRAKLRDNEDGTYVVHVHSNCWYELTRG